MKNLNRINLLRFVRGPEQIRTAVAAFAELSLATRPQDPFNLEMQKYNFFYITISFSCLISYLFKQVGHKQLSYCFFNSFNVPKSIKTVSHQQPDASQAQ